MRRSPAALTLAGLLLVAPPFAACAPAQAASAFETLPRTAPPHEPHKLAYACALAGAGLIAASFPLADESDRRYGAYLAEADPRRIDERYRATVRMDRLASGSLIAGQGLIALAVYLRFLRPGPESRVALVVEPAACAVTLRF